MRRTLSTPARIATLTAAPALLIGGVATTFQAQAATPRVTETALSATTTASGTSAKVSVTATSCLTVRSVGVAVRDAAGNHFDFPGWRHNVSICPTGLTVDAGTRQFPAGSYSMFGAYQDTRGSWHNLTAKTLTVGSAATPAPAATPTSGPSAGSTPSSTPSSAPSSASPTSTPTSSPSSSSPTPTPSQSATTTPPASGPASGPTGVGGNWSLNFDDEFNGSSLNTSVWRPGWFGSGLTNPSNGSETQGYDSNNVTESGGNLNLALTSTRGALVSTNPHDGRSSGGYEFTGAALMEARMYTPGTTSVDNWPAFWSDGQSWPANGEIDAVEGLGGNLCYHVHTNAGGPGGCTNAGPGWHTYGAYWNPTAQTVTFYYDGVQVGSEPFVNGGSPQYLILDNTSSSTPVADTMKVDWVRVWKPA